MSDQTLVLSDQHIDYWGNVYQANNLFARGITFETFVQYPCEILAAVIACRKPPLQDGQDYYPLLPAQECVRQRLALLDQGDAIQYELEHLFERQGHVVQMRGQQQLEPMRKRQPTPHWKSNTRRACA